MPTYDYECKKCGIFEKFQRITAEPIKKCPECGGPIRRLIGAGAGVIFKGSGFYATDYRSESYKRDAKKDEGLSKASDSKPSDKKASDSKASDSKTSEKKSDKSE